MTLTLTRILMVLSLTVTLRGSPPPDPGGRRRADRPDDAPASSTTWKAVASSPSRSRSPAACE